jgi:hypothetical protein
MWHAEACTAAFNSIDSRSLSSLLQVILTTPDGAALARGIRNSNPTFRQFWKTFLQDIKFRNGLHDHSQHFITL